MSGLRQIFFDTETTGLHAAQGDRVLDLGCVELLDRRPTGRHFHRFINPERESHPDALRVHGLTSEFLADKPKFADIAEDFLAFIAGAELLAHNASFDVGMLDAELARLRGQTGQQTVRVEHVTVQAGGQAVVGNVAARGRGDGNES